MKKGIVFVILCMVALPCMSANIALPKHPPLPAGDMMGLTQEAMSLRIVREDLVLDMTRRAGKKSRAEYRVENPLSSTVATELYFVTPAAVDIGVLVNNAAVPLKAVKIERSRAPWSVGDKDYRWWSPEQPLDAYVFSVSCEAKSRTVITVEFILPEGYDNTAVEYLAQGAVEGRITNWDKHGASAWYIYSLEAADTFRGSVEELHLTILTPVGTELKCNVPVIPVESASESDVIVYQGTFQGVPAPSVEALVVSQPRYVHVGGTVACGLTTTFAGYTTFLGQALVDVFFLNHQISSGVEFNPFPVNRTLCVPLLYSYVINYGPNSSLGPFFDLRIVAGALIVLTPEVDVGFRLGVSLKMGLTPWEIAYDFFPFDPQQGWVGRFTFLGKIMI